MIIRTIMRHGITSSLIAQVYYFFYNIVYYFEFKCFQESLIHSLKRFVQKHWFIQEWIKQYCCVFLASFGKYGGTRVGKVTGYIGSKR